MSRKPLDLAMLNKSLDERRNPNWDRDTQRAWQIANSITDNSQEFTVIEETEEEILISPAFSSLPSDEEIAAMKRKLAEQDKIEEHDNVYIPVVITPVHETWFTKLLKFLKVI